MVEWLDYTGTYISFGFCCYPCNPASILWCRGIGFLICM